MQHKEGVRDCAFFTESLDRSDSNILGPALCSRDGGLTEEKCVNAKESVSVFSCYTAVYKLIKFLN